MVSKSKFKTSKQGFTIVELMLAMTFVATLLISIAVVTINIVSIYQRGLALKAVNSVGRSLVEELTSSINSAPAVDTTSLCNHLASGGDEIGYDNKNACLADHAYHYIYNDRFETKKNRDGKDGTYQYSGVFCTGNYSYLWNTQYGLAKDGNRTLSLRYTDQSGSVQEIGAENARLLRIEDRTHRVCSAYLEAAAKNPGSTSNWVVDITKVAKNDVKNPIAMPTTGYLSAFDLDLLLYELTIQPISQDAVTLRTYMTGNFVLATERGGIDITTSGDYCQNSETSQLDNLGAEFNYCAINKFNFAARTAGV